MLAGGVSVPPDAPPGHGLYRDPDEPAQEHLATGRGAGGGQTLLHLLGRAAWSPGAGWDALPAHVVDRLVDKSGVGIIDDAGFPRQGEHSGRGGAPIQRDGGAHRERPGGVFTDWSDIAYTSRIPSR